MSYGAIGGMCVIFIGAFISSCVIFFAVRKFGRGFLYSFVSKEKMYVICGSGFLELKEVQLEGKKRMCIEDFLRGNRIENGMVLG